MRKSTFLITFLMLVSINFSGCISENSNSSMIDLSVNFQQTNGTIIETYIDGELSSIENVELSFDFSKTTSDEQIITYGISTNDGSQPITVEANSKSIISIEFNEHGIYHLDAYAVDSKNNIENISIFIRIDFRIDWVESNTNDPKPLSFNPIPDNNGTYPYMIEVSSMVENPSLIDEFGGGGQTIELTWKMFDESNDVCLSKSTQIEDGESDDWYAIDFNTYETHILRIEFDDGQDYVNIEQSISIIYHSTESEPVID